MATSYYGILFGKYAISGSIGTIFQAGIAQICGLKRPVIVISIAS